MKEQYNIFSIDVRDDFRFKSGANWMCKLEWLENASVNIEGKKTGDVKKFVVEIDKSVGHLHDYRESQV